MSRQLQFLILFAALAIVPLASQAPLVPGQQPPTFRVEVNYVEIDARATDAQGKFVDDLTKDDFQIVEDGAPQTIKVFSRVNLPVERQDPPLFKNAAIEPDVRSNREAFNGRVFVLVLDDLQTDFRRSTRVRKAARQFIERYIGANDLAAVVYTGGVADRAQEFTNSRARLLASVDKFSGSKLPSETMAKLDDYYHAKERQQQPQDTYLQERGYKARNSLITLRNLAQYLSSVRGRHKAVVWFGEGIDYDTDNPFTPDGSLLRDTMKDAIAEATRAGVSFYGVDARGLGAGLDDVMDIGSLPADDPTIESPSTTIQNEVRRAQDSLRVMSEQTGGFAIVNQNDFNTGFQKIIEDNSSYYVLGYYPTNDKRDGRLRKVDVRVTRPGVHVQARSGYSAPKGKPASAASAKADTKVPAEILDALANPISSAGVGLSVFAAPFSGPGAKASVALTVEFAPATLRFVEQSGKFNEDIELHVLAVDASGKMQDGGPTTLPLRLSAGNHDAVSTYGLRVLRRLTVPPGRYQIRVAAKESNGGAIGTVTQSLDVPDFSKGPLQMSGIAITSKSAVRLPTANPDPQLKDVLPGAPSASRDFPRGDTLAIFAEVYDNQAAPHRVSIASSILADDGRELFAAADERSSDELQGKKGGYGYTRELPLGDLSPGRYVLRLTARSLLANNATTTREVEFRIR